MKKINSDMEENNKEKLKDADIIIFGGLGDLALRKIFPALFYRLESGQINQNSKIYPYQDLKKVKINFRNYSEIIWRNI